HEYRRSGLRAVQPTPLFTGDGRVVGMLSTHWRSPHEVRAEELRRIDLLAGVVRAQRSKLLDWAPKRARSPATSTTGNGQRPPSSPASKGLGKSSATSLVQ